MTEFAELVEREVASLVLQTTYNVADEHQWRGGYFCSCGHELNSPGGFSRHLSEQVLGGLQPFIDSLQVALRAEHEATDSANRRAVRWRERYDDAVAEAARRDEEREQECDSGEER